MRIHDNLVKAITAALDAVFDKGQKADTVVKHTLKSESRWGSRDRRFVAAAIYDIVRWKRKYAAVAESLTGRKDYPALFWIWAVAEGHELPYWAEIENLDPKVIHEALSTIEPRAIRESIPDWLDNRGEEELGPERWEKELTALNKEADVVIRLNTQLTNPNRLQQWLKEEGIETEKMPGFPDALRLQKRRPVQHSKAFKIGHFEIQDANSQMVAPMLNPQKGEFIIDTCAGAGGKSLHLACLMKDQGEILAMDIHGKKLQELKKRAKRSQLRSIQTLHVNKKTDLTEYHGKADKVLVDAPCSGLGVLRRNPDTKWKLTADKLLRYTELQQQLLQRYSALVRPGGALVYATCSILPSENQEQIQKFLESEAGAGFELTEEYTLWPSVTGFDGFYVGRLQLN